MVLGISIRKKKQAADVPKPMRTPSLPDIRAQSVVWPESLVDLPLYNRPAPDVSTYPVPQSKFTRTPSLPSTTNNRRASVSTRRTRAPAPFNLMVAGPRGVGKSALLRLLVQMSDPAVQPELPFRPTRSLTTSTVELSGPERVVLTLIDTPGLDYSVGAELELEKAVTALVKHVDTQYAETLGEESKVVRQSKGDHHVHLCLYLIDPSSVLSPAQRQRAQTLRASRSYSAFTRPRSDTPDSSSHDSDGDSDSEETIGLAPSEIRAIQRLAGRTNVLPVIARGDTLTDARLEKVRNAVRRDLARSGIDMSVFGIGEDEPTERGRVESRVAPDNERKVIKIRSTRQPSRARSSQGPDEPVPELPKSVRLGQNGNGLASSPKTPDAHHIPPVDDTTLTRMFPLVIIAPDAVKSKRKTKPKSNGSLRDSGSAESPGTPTAITTDSPDLPNAELGKPPTSSTNSGRSPSAYTTSMLPPSSWRPALGAGGARSHSVEPNEAAGRTYPKGLFTRKYRWGTIDVLDPTHCDVGILWSVILGSHLKALKVHTREVLYERFRTEKLLARRATQNITPEQRSRLMKGLDP